LQRVGDVDEAIGGEGVEGDGALDQRVAVTAENTQALPV
jgi:hypothetical protein